MAKKLYIVYGGRRPSIPTSRLVGLVCHHLLLVVGRDHSDLFCLSYRLRLPQPMKIMLYLQKYPTYCLQNKYYTSHMEASTV